MLLFFDTETTGLVKWKSPPEDGEQPEVVQYAALVCENNGTERGSISTLVRHYSEIHPKAQAVHGITKELTEKWGMHPFSLTEIHERFLGLVDKVVCHNVPFDKLVMSALSYTANNRDINEELMKEKEYFCTMQESTDVLKLPGRFGKYKWPKLTEACEFFFGIQERFKFEEEAHDALVDVRMTKKVYFAIKDA